MKHVSAWWARVVDRLVEWRHRMHWEDHTIKVTKDGEAYTFCQDCGWRSNGLMFNGGPKIRKALAGDPARHALGGKVLPFDQELGRTRRRR